MNAVPFFFMSISYLNYFLITLFLPYYIIYVAEIEVCFLIIKALLLRRKSITIVI